MKYIFTGGSGLLGHCMKYHFKYDLFPKRQELDFTNLENVYDYLSKNKTSKLIHMGAETNTVGTENNREVTLNSLKTNIVGTCNLVEVCSKLDIKLIYISTDYVFNGEKEVGEYYYPHDDLNPINKYGWSKLGGECAVRMYDNSLIIRTSFCENFFKYKKAFIDQWTTRDTVYNTSIKIKKEIIEDKKGIVHIGSNNTKSIYELAKELSPHVEIEPISRTEVYPIPRNTSLKN